MNNAKQITSYYSLMAANDDAAEEYYNQFSDDRIAEISVAMERP